MSNQSPEQNSWYSYTTPALHDPIYNANQAEGLVRDPRQESNHIEGYLLGLEGLENTANLVDENDTPHGQAFTADDGDEPFLDNISPAEASPQFLTVLPFRQGNGSDPYTGVSGTQGSRTSTSSGPLSSIASDVGEETSEPRHNCESCSKSYKLKSSLRYVSSLVVHRVFLINQHV